MPVPAELRAVRLRVPAYALAVLGAGLAVMSAVITLSSDAPGHHVRAAVLHTLIVLVPIGVGMWAIARPRHRRFGWLLVGCGCVWSLATLGESDSSLLYSLGRVAGWFVTVLTVWLILAFPSGRLEARADRILMGLAWATLALLYLPTALLVDGFPAHTPWALCRDACPANAFQLSGHEPAVIEALVRPVRDLLTIAVFVAVIGRLVRRGATASPLRRRTLWPVAVAAITTLVCLTAFVATRRLAPGSAAGDTMGWLYGLSIAGIALAFLGGLLIWELFVGRALRTLAVTDPTNPRELQAALRRALEDPSLMLAFRQGDAWVDVAATPIDVADARDHGRALTVEWGRGEPVLTLIADSALVEDTALCEIVTSYTLAAMHHRRLEDRLRDSFDALEESRRRTATIADDERRRIERDLHDGAQQRLVAIGIKLSVAGEMSERDPVGGARLLSSLGDEVSTAIEEVRSFAHGTGPHLLEQRGLADALRAAAESAALPITVASDPIGRYPPAVERAVYFTCMEAVQNAAKHARGATVVTIAFDTGDELRFTVCDDGAGFDPAAPRHGAGLTSMRDRLSAVGGSLTVRSARGEGTCVTGVVGAGARRAAPAR